MSRKKNKNPKGISKIFKIMLLSFFCLIILATAFIYLKVTSRHSTSQFPQKDHVLIPTGASFEDVILILQNQQLIENTLMFREVAKLLHYPDHIRPGRYKLSPQMSLKDLVILLRSGKQDPVRLQFHNIRTVTQLAGIVASQLEADSLSIISLLNNDAFLDSIGKNRYSVAGIFIPNTYELYWNTSARQFAERMLTEYNRFWNPTRKSKAEAAGLTPDEVCILASIVEKETSRSDEKPMVAGVYMNRLRKNWKLEADPTLIFAANDFSIKRVLNIHKAIDSPFNTYKYNGLPPGPICLPSISSVDAVLNYRKHDYMFFCAKEDFSGYHNFAVSYADHARNARKFQNELNRRKITS